MAVRVAFNRFGSVAREFHDKLRALTFIAATNVAERAAASMEGKEAPSAPGTPPAIRTGILHASFKVEQTGDLEHIVGTDVEYAPHLEFGTVRMAERPFLTPAVMDELPLFHEAVTRLGESVR